MAIGYYIFLESQYFNKHFDLRNTPVLYDFSKKWKTNFISLTRNTYNDAACCDKNSKAVPQHAMEALEERV
jgi:hypothetical protein